MGEFVSQLQAHVVSGRFIISLAISIGVFFVAGVFCGGVCVLYTFFPAIGDKIEDRTTGFANVLAASGSNKLTTLMANVVYCIFCIIATSLLSLISTRSIMGSVYFFLIVLIYFPFMYSLGTLISNLRTSENKEHIFSLLVIAIGTIPYFFSTKRDGIEGLIGGFSPQSGMFPLQMYIMMKNLSESVGDIQGMKFFIDFQYNELMKYMKNAALVCNVTAIILMLINGFLPGRPFAGKKSFIQKLFPLLDYIYSTQNDSSVSQLTSDEFNLFNGNRRQQHSAASSIDNIGMEIRNFSKKYGSFSALKPTNIRFMKNEIYALLGPNGAGKSTLIRSLIGLDAPTTGSVWMPTNSVRNTDGSLRMGICFQEDAIRSALSVRWHLQLMANIRQVPNVAVEVNRVLNIVGLQTHQNYKAGKLSGGQKRRLCAAMALIGSPQVVIMDEPTSGIDPATRHAIWDAIRQEKTNKVIILTTHFMEEADYLAEKVGILNKGELQCEGSQSYLQKVYETDDRITVVLDKNRSDLNVVKYVADVIQNEINSIHPNAVKSVVISGVEIEIRIPVTLDYKMPEFLRCLEDPSFRQVHHVIVSISLSCGKLNEVFFKAVDEDDLSVQAGKAAEAIGQDFGVLLPSNIDPNSNQETPLIENGNAIVPSDISHLKVSSDQSSSFIGRQLRATLFLLVSKIWSKTPIVYIRTSLFGWITVLLFVATAAAGMFSFDENILDSINTVPLIDTILRSIALNPDSSYCGIDRAERLLNDTVPHLLHLSGQGGDGTGKKVSVKNVGQWMDDLITIVNWEQSLLNADFATNRFRLQNGEWIDSPGREGSLNSIFDSFFSIVGRFEVDEDRRRALSRHLAAKWLLKRFPSSLPDNLENVRRLVKNIPEKLSSDRNYESYFMTFDEDFFNLFYEDNKCPFYDTVQYHPKTKEDPYYYVPVGGSSYLVDDQQYSAIRDEFKDMNIFTNDELDLVKIFLRISASISNNLVANEVAIESHRRLAGSIKEPTFDNNFVTLLENARISEQKKVDDYNNKVKLSQEKLRLPVLFDMASYARESPYYTCPRKSDSSTLFSSSRDSYNLVAHRVFTKLSFATFIFCFAIGFICISWGISILHKTLQDDVQSGMLDFLFVNGVPPVGMFLANIFDAIFHLVVLISAFILLFWACSGGASNLIRGSIYDLYELTSVVWIFALEMISISMILNRILPAKFANVICMLYQFCLFIHGMVFHFLPGSNGRLGAKKGIFLYNPLVYLFIKGRQSAASIDISRKLSTYNEETFVNMNFIELHANTDDSLSITDSKFDMSGLFIEMTLLLVAAFIIELLQTFPFIFRWLSPLYIINRHRAQTVDPYTNESGHALFNNLESMRWEEVTANNCSTTDHPVIVRGVKKVYNFFKPLVSVRGVSFHVKEGECLGYLGVNGAGKSSTMKMLIGEEFANSGDAFICNNSITTALTSARSSLGYCPQHSILWPGASGRFHLQFFASCRGLMFRHMKKHLDELIISLGMDDFIDRKVSSYSGGMKRRLSVAIALVGDPRVMLLDEPTSGVDPVSRRQMWRLIMATCQGRSTLLTTHSMDEAEALSDRIAIMAKGQIRCIGTSQELRHHFSGASGVIEVDLTAAVPAHLAHMNREHQIATYAAMFELRTALNCDLALNAQNQYVTRAVFMIKELMGQRATLSVTPTYQTGEGPLKISDVLGACQRLKEAGLVSNYSTSTASLEQVFISIAQEANTDAFDNMVQPVPLMARPTGDLRAFLETLFPVPLPVFDPMMPQQQAYPQHQQQYQQQAYPQHQQQYQQQQAYPQQQQAYPQQQHQESYNNQQQP